MLPPHDTRKIGFHVPNMTSLVAIIYKDDASIIFFSAPTLSSEWSPVELLPSTDHEKLAKQGTSNEKVLFPPDIGQASHQVRVRT